MEASALQAKLLTEKKRKRKARDALATAPNTEAPGAPTTQDPRSERILKKKSKTRKMREVRGSASAIRGKRSGHVSVLDCFVPVRMIDLLPHVGYTHTHICWFRRASRPGWSIMGRRPGRLLQMHCPKPPPRRCAPPSLRNERIYSNQTGCWYYTHRCEQCFPKPC
jgi:hypothetical protein